MAANPQTRATVPKAAKQDFACIKARLKSEAFMPIEPLQPTHSSAIGDDRELNAELVVELPVANLTASLAFYRQAGFVVERATPTFAVLRWRRSWLLLVQSTGFTPALMPPNIRVMVDDLEVALAQAKRCGWPLRAPAGNRNYGLRDFTVADPDGYELRFATVLAGR
jgi:catechol 2,3-dioxygenase-like lactoylglutathione lyase family enzyme